MDTRIGGAGGRDLGMRDDYGGRGSGMNDYDGGRGRGSGIDDYDGRGSGMRDDFGPRDTRKNFLRKSMERDNDNYGGDGFRTGGMRLNKSKVRTRKNTVLEWRIFRNLETGEKTNKFFNMCSYMISNGVMLKDIRKTVKVRDRRDMGILSKQVMRQSLTQNLIEEIIDVTSPLFRNPKFDIRDYKEQLYKQIDDLILLEHFEF